jgi:hypothetical protein
LILKPRACQRLYYNASITTLHMAQLKDLVDGSVVGSGSDYIVIQKGKKRIMLECAGFKLQELKTHGTPYGSQFD